MNWKQERDLLIAQTMAFAQSVTGKAAEADSPLEVAPLEVARLEVAPFEAAPFEAARFEPVSANAPAEAAPRVAAHPIARPATPYHNPRHNDLCDEIRRRVAAFRAHQELLRRDRDEYYNSVLAKVHASAEHGRKAPDDSPVKR
jgi:hypothetical protein